MPYATNVIKISPLYLKRSDTIALSITAFILRSRTTNKRMPTTSGCLDTFLSGVSSTDTRDFRARDAAETS